MIRAGAVQAAGGLALLAALAAAPGARAGSAPLERAQALFAENRWPQVREVLRAGWDALGPDERPLAQLLIGRSLAREAELYRAARRFAHEVGFDYMRALAEPGQPRLRWVPWFSGAYELAAGRYEAAERALGKAAEDTSLPPQWRVLARLRRAVARHRLGQSESARALLADRTHEGSYWRLVLPGLAPGEPPPAAPASDLDRLFAACALLRSGKSAQAEALLARTDLDRPALEDASEPRKLLRFYDPLTLEVLERIRWEQAAAALEPLGAGAGTPRAALGAFYAAWSLYQIGQRDAARAKLAGFSAAGQLVGSLRERAEILTVALAPGEKRASPAELGALWQRSQADPENVLLWAELEAREWPGVEPLAGALPPRLEALGNGPTPLDRASGGRWGLVRLRSGADPTSVLARLSKIRESASKNQIERNDPLLLLALAIANYRSAAYAQSLETLFALSQAYPGLRGLHWNLQGVYAARQSAGGETRISP